MEVITQIKINKPLFCLDTLTAWSTPQLSQPLLIPPCISDNSKDLSSMPSLDLAPSKQLDTNINEFSDLFENAKSPEEEINFLNRVLKMNSSVLQRFTSCKGLRIFNRILYTSLSKDPFPVDVVGKVLACLDRITIRPTVLEKLKIYNLIQQVKQHRRAPEGTKKLASDLLIKWKGLVSSGNIEGLYGSDINNTKDLMDRNTIGQNFYSENNTHNFNFKRPLPPDNSHNHGKRIISPEYDQIESSRFQQSNGKNFSSLRFMPNKNTSHHGSIVGSSPNKDIDVSSIEKMQPKPKDLGTPLAYSPYRPTYKPTYTKLEDPKKMIKQSIYYNPLNPYHNHLDVITDSRSLLF